MAENNLEWLENPEEALNIVKCSNSMLIVLVTDESEDSFKMLEMVNNSETVTCLREMTCVKLKIASDSTIYTHFSSVYTSTESPCICLISSSGNVLDIIKIVIPVNRFIQVLRFAYQSHIEFGKMRGIPDYTYKEELEANITSNKEITQVAAVDLIQKMSDSNMTHDLIDPNTILKRISVVPAKINCLARIQFRLPDATTLIHSFPIDANLLQVRKYVQEKLNTPPSRFTLTLIYPRRELSQESNNERLDTLNLAPSCNISVTLIQPLIENSRRNELFAYLINLIWYLLSIASLQLSSIFRKSNTTSVQSTPLFDANNSLKRKNITPEGDSDSKHIKRSDNNMRRLADIRKDDEDMSTYNGNSTQQQ